MADIEDYIVRFGWQFDSTDPPKLSPEEQAKWNAADEPDSEMMLKFSALWYFFGTSSASDGTFVSPAYSFHPELFEEEYGYVNPKFWINPYTGENMQPVSPDDPLDVRRGNFSVREFGDKVQVMLIHPAIFAL